MKYCFIFVLSFLACFATVYGVGEVVLDQIVPNGDLVSFQDPLYTDHGSIETITTDTFGVTRQFELNVHAADVVLNGLEGGIEFYGSLGTTLSTIRGDISFLASNTTSVAGSEITAIARELLEIGSQAGDVIFNAENGSLELVAGTASISAENVLDVATLGAMSFSSGEMLSLQSDLSISLTAAEDFTFEAKSGNVLFAAGNELVLSSSSTIELDGTNSVSIDTSGSLDLIAGSKVQFTGITSDFLVKDNSTISYNLINVFADDGVVVGGRAVQLNAANRVVVNTDSPGADISVDFGSLLTISAESDLSLHATGETGNIIIHASSFVATFTEDFSSSSTILNFGGASTNSISLASTEYAFTSNNIGISAVESISIASKTSTSFKSNDQIINTPLWTLTAASSTMNIDAKDFNLFSGISQLPVSFSSAASTTISANNVLLEAGELTIKSVGNSLFNVDDLTITSSTDSSVDIKGANIVTTIGDDMTLSTGEFITDSAQFSLFLENDFSLEADKFFMEFENTSFDVSTTDDSSFELNSARHLFIEGDQFLLDVGSDLSIGVTGGMYFDSNDDVFFITSGPLSFDASKTIHLDVFESSVISGGDLTIDSGDNIYLKTSILTLEGLDDLGVSANSISAAFGDLSFEAGTEIEFNSADDLTINAGGDVNLTSEGDQLYEIANELAYNVEESVEYYAGGEFSVTATEDIEFFMSQEFEFNAKEMNITTSVTAIDGETVQYSTDGMFDVDSSSSVDLLGGDFALSSAGDVTINALDSLSMASEMRTNIESSAFYSESLTSLIMEVGETNIVGDTFTVMAATDLTLSSLETSISSADSLIESTEASSVSADRVRLVSGPNRHLDVKSAAVIEFNTLNEQNFYSGSFINAVAGVDFSVSSEQIALTSEDFVTFYTDATLDIVATTLATFISAEDLSLQTEGTSNIVLSSGDMHTVTYGRDFHFLAQGVEGDCAITIDSLAGGSTLQSNVGALSLKAFTEMSLVSETDFAATASGNVFVNSFESGLLFFAEGATAGITLETTASAREELSNIELSAVAAEIELFAFDGIELDSTGNTQFLAEEGIHFFALRAEDAKATTISFTSGADAHIDGARGVSFLAGLDAPVIDADFTISSDFLRVESQDAINMLAIGTFSALMSQDVNFSTFEGNNINFSSAANYELMSTKVTRFTATDGDIVFTANANDLEIATEGEFSLDTLNGPIDIIGFAGSVTFSGQDWDLASEMDTRFSALGAITMDALTDFTMNSFDGECIVLQTQRAGDRISFFGDVITASSTPVDNLDFNDIQVLGNNIDFLATESATWTSTGGDISIGLDSSPVVTMIAGGDDVLPGLLLSSDFDIQIASQSDFLETSLDTLIEVTTGRMTSTGEIAFSAGAADMLLVSETNILLDTDVYIGAVVGDYTATTNDFLLAASLSPNTADPIGVLTVAVGGAVIEDSSESTWSADGLHTLDVTGAVSYTATTDLLVSSNAEPLETERATIDYTMSDFMATVVTSTTFDVTEPDSEMLFSTDGVLDITAEDITLLATELDSLLKINALGAFTIITETFMADTQPIDDGTYREHFAAHPSDITVTGSEISVTGTSGIDLLSTVGTVVEAGGATSFTLADSFDVQIIGSGVSSLIDFVAGTETFLFADALTFDGVELPTLESTFFIGSDKDLLIDSPIMNYSFQEELLSQSESIRMSANTELDTSGVILTLQTTGYTSDIIHTGSDYNIEAGDVRMSAYDAFDMSVNTFTIVSDSFSAIATFGDLFVESPSIVVDLATDVQFLATGFQSDKAQAIDIFSSDIDITTVSGMVIEAKDTIQFSGDLVQFDGASLSFISSGFESPISISATTFNSASATTTMAAGSIASIDANVIDLSAPTISIDTAAPRSGILFDTNPIRNANTQINNSAPAVTFLGDSILVTTDYTTGAGATIELQSGAAFTHTITESMSLLAEEGDIAFVNSGILSLISGQPIAMTATTTSFIATSLELSSDSLFIQSTHGDVLMTRDSSTSTVVATSSIDFNTIARGRNTDVVFFSEALSITADQITLQGAGGDTGILIEYDFTPASFVGISAAAGTFSTVSKSGISLVGTRHPNPGADSIISFVTTNVMEMQTLDNRGIIAFQSDTDVVFAAGQGIRHTNYAARLGFFSVTPDYIHLTNMQVEEGCLRGGHCGFTSPRRGDNANAGIRDINDVSLVLLRYMKSFGLVNWKNPTV